MQQTIGNITNTERLSSITDIDFSKYDGKLYTESPQDWRDIIIYQLRTDRFNNDKNQPHYQWDNEINKFQGGTFEGIMQQIDYLAELGVKGIWLSPVQQNCQYREDTYHGYGIQDFLKIDKRFANDKSNPEEELKRLIKAIHDKGMYVIFDIVLNHSGNVFEYENIGDSTHWHDQELPIRWKNENGEGIWNSPPDTDVNRYAGIGPKELFKNELWRRQGKGDERGGDFETLKELRTEHSYQGPYGEIYDVRDILIKCYKYLMAEFDVDGFRIDTLKYISRDFSKTFGNAIREYALRLGKKNFLTYGEVWDSYDKISRFVGRYPNEDNTVVGVDSAIDFPLNNTLVSVTKGFSSPIELINLFKSRKEAQANVISSHGDASRFFITFLDNHDMKERYLYEDRVDQLTLAITCLFSLQGIPCIYYGTEQGLNGRGNSLEAVREALWGKTNAFDRNNMIYKKIKGMSEMRNKLSALRYGRQYFREISGNGFNFEFSNFTPGVIAFSRILGRQEVLVVANCSNKDHFRGEVVIDPFLNETNNNMSEVFSNINSPLSLTTVNNRDNIYIYNRQCNIKSVRIELQPNEVKVLSNI